MIKHRNFAIYSSVLHEKLGRPTNKWREQGKKNAKWINCSLLLSIHMSYRSGIMIVPSKHRVHGTCIAIVIECTGRAR